jgi:hypothetical protein
MRWLLNTLDAWLFSPPHSFESVLRTTDIVLCASDEAYARWRGQPPLFQGPQATQPADLEMTARPVENIPPNE